MPGRIALLVPGIDAVMIGPADLSISLGVPGDFQHPKNGRRHGGDPRHLQRERHVAPGTHTRNVPLARFWKERGMRFLGCGSDIAFLWDKASETARGVLA